MSENLSWTSERHKDPLRIPRKGRPAVPKLVSTPNIPATILPAVIVDHPNQTPDK
jgi:hypothetical protein